MRGTRTAGRRLRSHVNILLTSSAIAAVLLGAVWWHGRRLRRKPRVLAEILDHADALERELLACRARLREIPALTADLPPAEQLSARVTLAAEPQVQEALRDLLAHRLWLKAHAASATIASLAEARDALAATRASLAGQSARLAAARAEFERTRAEHALPSDPAR